MPSPYRPPKAFKRMTEHEQHALCVSVYVQSPTGLIMSNCPYESPWLIFHRDNIYTVRWDYCLYIRVIKVKSHCVLRVWKQHQTLLLHSFEWYLCVAEKQKRISPRITMDLISGLRQENKNMTFRTVNNVTCLKVNAE